MQLSVALLGFPGGLVLQSGLVSSGAFGSILWPEITAVAGAADKQKSLFGFFGDVDGRLRAASFGEIRAWRQFGNDSSPSGNFKYLAGILAAVSQQFFPFLRGFPGKIP